MKEEYAELIKAIHATETSWADADPEDVLENGKAVVTIFTVVQATARKLQEGEDRGKVLKGVMAHAKASPHWGSFPEDLVAEIENFQKENDGNDL